jgi:hypothetical protein
VTAPVKLLAYALALVAIFLLAYAVGAVAGPLGGAV